MVYFDFVDVMCKQVFLSGGVKVGEGGGHFEVGIKVPQNLKSLLHSFVL